MLSFCSCVCVHTTQRVCVALCSEQFTFILSKIERLIAEFATIYNKLCVFIVKYMIQYHFICSILSLYLGENIHFTIKIFFHSMFCSYLFQEVAFSIHYCVICCMGGFGSVHDEIYPRPFFIISILT